MSSIFKLEKFNGDGTHDVNEWWTSFGQWSKFHYNLSNSKIIDAFPFYLEGHGKVWYVLLSTEQRYNTTTIINYKFV